jgi:hypothetical protein
MCKGLYVTENFANTVRVDDSSLYLRYADAMLVFKDGALLISDREADGIFDQLCKWQRKSKVFFNIFINYFYYCWLIQ